MCIPHIVDFNAAEWQLTELCLGHLEISRTARPDWSMEQHMSFWIALLKWRQPRNLLQERVH